MNQLKLRLKHNNITVSCDFCMAFIFIHAAMVIISLCKCIAQVTFNLTISIFKNDYSIITINKYAKTYLIKQLFSKFLI